MEIYRKLWKYMEMYANILKNIESVRKLKLHEKYRKVRNILEYIYIYIYENLENIEKYRKYGSEFKKKIVEAIQNR